MDNGLWGVGSARRGRRWRSRGGVSDLPKRRTSNRKKEHTDDEIQDVRDLREDEDFEDSISSVSNEGDDSEDEDQVPEIKRDVAQVFPEEQWGRLAQRFQRLLLSCLLPLLLALLLIFAVFRMVKLLLQLLNDVYIVVRYVLLLCIRIALFPLYLLWLCLPSCIRNFISKRCERRFGPRVRALLQLKQLVEETIADSPDMLWACVVALYSSCLQPMGRTCRDLCWVICGQAVVNTVFDPLHDAQVNKASWNKRKFVEGRGNKKRAAASQAMMASAHLRRAKATALRARARRRREKRRQREHQIHLSLPTHHRKLLKAEDFVQLEEHNPAKLKSRVLIVERRYAVFVGLAWMLAGQAILVITLAGSEGETCTICSEIPALGMRMCQRGEGRYCAFEYHGTQIVASIVLMGVGLLLAIYATCLYRPRSKSSEAIAEEEALAKKHYEALAAKLKKTEDLESQVYGMLEDHFDRPSCAKNMRRCYYASPLGHFQGLLDSCGYCLLDRGLRCEQRCRLRQRSLWLQELCLFLSFGWILKLTGNVARCISKRCCEKKVRRKSEAKTRPPRCAALQRALNRCYIWRAFMYWTGLGRYGAEGHEAFDAKLVSSAKRSDARGVRSLEETLAHFELLAPQEDAENVGVLESLLEAGFEEKMFEAGFTGGSFLGQDEVLELDLHLVDEDQAIEVPEELPEDDDLMDCEEELHIN